MKWVMLKINLWAMNIYQKIKARTTYVFCLYLYQIVSFKSFSYLANTTFYGFIFSPNYKICPLPLYILPNFRHSPYSLRPVVQVCLLSLFSPPVPAYGSD